MKARVTLAALLALALPTPAYAVEDCSDAQPSTQILGGQGSLESIVAGPDGALYYTDQDRQALMRLDRPGAEPAEVAGGLPSPGGLLVGLDGTSIIVGQGNGIGPGAVGTLAGQAKLFRVDIATGEKTVVAEGLSMANGLARDAAGVIYASDDVSVNIDRVEGSQVTPGWAKVLSPNGLAIDSAGRYLYAAQTFVPAAIARIDLQDPAKTQTYATPGPEDIPAGLDGMTIDQDDRLFVTANLWGEVWRVDTDRSMCRLASGVTNASAVAFGAGGAFPADSLYAVGFGGTITEIPKARALPPLAEAPLEVAVHPRRIRAQRRTRVMITVSRNQPVEGARVRIGRRRATTGADGIAHLRVRARRRGRMMVRVRSEGETARATLRVLRAGRGPRPRARTG